MYRIFVLRQQEKKKKKEKKMLAELAVSLPPVVF